MNFERTLFDQTTLSHNNQNFQARVIPGILFIFYFIRNVIFISNVSLVTAR
jgi:hypothetical protein